ncbi:MAG: choice-of-anchor J domain-containing protein [Muribaculaceae bacterium]|nr:choice-of-anchor J domain-containing protein [Muribaculaceae bacterium]
MKKFLLFGLAALSITCAEAAAPMLKTHSDDVLWKNGNVKHVDRSSTLDYNLSGTRNVMKKAGKVSAPKGYVLYENFSGWDGSSQYWLPDGWEVDHRSECSMKYTWTPFEPNQYYPALADGKYCLAVSFAETKQDEWLITPEITPADNMILSYYMMMNPFYFYDTRNLNYITKEYEGGKIVLYTLQILVKEEGGEWELLRDYAEEYKDCTYRELRNATNGSELVKQTIDLKEYAGKNIRIAFRYVGDDGDTMMLDAVGVGYPTLDDVWYMEPTNALYWGLSCDANFVQTSADIAFYPPNAPITWSNMSSEDADYTWQYSGLAGTVSNEDPYELSMTYDPVRPGLTPKLFNYPVLNATASERIDRYYISPVEYFQVGGSTTFVTDGIQSEHTAFQYPMNTLDFAFKDVRYDRLGVYSLPVYGYTEYSDDYWLDYSLNGEEAKEGNFSHLIGIGNLFFASHDAPLVVKGMSIYGWGRFWDDAELTATIYALDKDMHTDYNTYTVVARATLMGKDVQSLNGEDAKDYLYLPFQFDEPAVIQASEEHPVFLFMLEGFRSDKVDYFAPLHNYIENEFGFSAGYMLHEINLQGHVEGEVNDGTYYSLKSTRHVENGVYVDHPRTFAIGVNAEYPWLTSQVDEIEIRPEDEKVTVNLNSFYGPEQLKIETPEGVAASLTGQYDECVLTVTKTDTTKPSEGNINITGPGVALSLAVKDHTPNAVASIETSNDVVAIYDMSGRKISSTKAAGVYVVKYSDGKVRKVTVK